MSKRFDKNNKNSTEISTTIFMSTLSCHLITAVIFSDSNLKLQHLDHNQTLSISNCTHREMESRSTPDEAFFHLFLHCPEVILDARSFADFKRVVAVGKNDWLQVSFWVEVDEVCRTCVSAVNAMCFQPAYNITTMGSVIYQSRHSFTLYY